MEKNVVVLSVEEYNKLLLENHMFKSMIVVQKDYWGTDLEIRIKPQVLEPYITEAFNNSQFAKTHILKPSTEWYDLNSKVGQIIPVEEDSKEEVAEV